MKIVLSKKVAMQVLTTTVQTKAHEFSGFGFVKRRKNSLFVYDFALLALGSWSYTEIDPKSILPLLDREDAENMKCWIHIHPMGNGIPGEHNWSGTDVSTIKQTPMGSIPELVKWSASVVLTPEGWVGRIDNYVNGKTLHVPVEPKISQFFHSAKALPAFSIAQEVTSYYQSKRTSTPAIDQTFAEEIADLVIEDYADLFDGKENVRQEIVDYVIENYIGMKENDVDVYSDIVDRFVNDEDVARYENPFYDFAEELG